MTQRQSFFDYDSPGASRPQNASSESKPGPTFREQGKIWIARLATRNWKPVQPSTILHWTSVLENWIYPAIGEVHLSDLNDASIKQLVCQMADAGLSGSTMGTYIQVVNMVVRSFVDDYGARVYSHAWTPRFLDMAQLSPLQPNAPCFPAEIMSGLSRWESPTERMLFILAGASGARLGELLGIEIDRHISPDLSTLRIAQTFRTPIKSPWAKREIDLHSSVSKLLSRYLGDRRSGLLFCSRSGDPLDPRVILRHHLQPALKQLGLLDPQNNATRAGFHAFRRFRKAHLVGCDGLPVHLQNYWMGRRDDSFNMFYGRPGPDRALRKHWAERSGIGFDLNM